MTRDDFNRFARELQNDAWQVLKDKGEDYARASNPFHNFETTGQFTGQTREQVLGGHMYKHVAALYRYIRDGKVDSEGLRGRAIDLINYVTFLAAMADQRSNLGDFARDTYDSEPEGPFKDALVQELVDIAPGRDVVVDDNPYRLTTRDGKRVYVYTNGVHKEDL